MARRHGDAAHDAGGEMLTKGLCLCNPLITPPQFCVVELVSIYGDILVRYDMTRFTIGPLFGELLAGPWRRLPRDLR